MKKLNDWLVASINNPDFTDSDLVDSGLDISNTQMLSKDEYLKSDFIKNKFTKDDKFDSNAFDKFYNLKLESFKDLLKKDLKKAVSYDFFDTSRKPGDKVTNPNFTLLTVANPDRTTTGISGRNEIGKPKLSKMELAETQSIYDPETDTWSKDTVNDRALSNSPVKWFKSLFEEPLVLAQYEQDEDTYNPLTGQTEHHRKGEYKLNKYGTYYTEKLNGRSLIGKEVTSAFDTLTVDGEGINKYDFFDSDDLDKSTAGVIAKSAATVLPLFITGPVATIYGGAMVAKETAKTLPMLYGMLTSWLGVTEDSKILNDLAGYGAKFSQGVSQKSKESNITFENLANMMTDVALQWGQLKFIANSLGKLKNEGKLVDEAYLKAYGTYLANSASLTLQAELGAIEKGLLESYLGNPAEWLKSAIGAAAIKKFVPDAIEAAKNASKFGADASLVYMALVSNTDVYNDVLQAGATKKEAAAVALGSTLGMFAVDKYAHLGELFFDDETSDVERAIRSAFKKESNSWKTVLNDIAKLPESKNKLKLFLKAGISLGKSTVNKFSDDLKYHSLGFLGKSLGEGLEEVGEEIVSDVFKSIYELAGDFGMNTSVKDVGAWDNMVERYGMSFLGGALGGGLFYGVDAMQNRKNQELKDELIYLARNGHLNKAYEELEKNRKAGKFGSTNLSATKYQVDPETGEKTYLTAESEEDSLNEFIYKRIKELMTQLDNILNENLVGLSDDELFTQMILSEKRFADLQNYLDAKLQSYTTGYQQEFLNLCKDIVTTTESYNRALKTLDGIDPGENTEENNIPTDELFRHMTKELSETKAKNLLLYKDKLAALQIERDKFLNGDYSLPYTEKMLFFIDNNLNAPFMSSNYEQWVKNNHHKTLELLTEAELVEYKTKYLEYKKNKLKDDLTTAFSTYKEIKAMVDPFLKEVLQNLNKFKTFLDKISKLFGNDSPFNLLRLYGWDDILDFVGEKADTVQEHQLYLQSLDEELEQNRIDLINKENARIANEFKSKVLSIVDEAGGMIDSPTRRRIKLALNSRNKDLINRLKGTVKLSLSVIDDKNALDVFNIIDLLDTKEFSNIKDISDLLKLYIISKHIDSYKAQRNLNDAFRDLLELAGYDVDKDSLPDSLLKYIEDSKQLLKDKLSEKGITLDDNKLNELLFTATGTGEFNADSIKVNGSNISLTANPLIWGLDLEAAGANIAQLLSFLTNVLQDAYNNNSFNSINLDFVDNSELENKVLSDNSEELEYYLNTLNNYIDSIKNNGLILLNNELDKRISQINPVIDLVKKIALKMNKSTPEVESVLEKLSTRFDEIEDINDLQLSETEMNAFDEVEDLIEKTKAYLYAASTKSNMLMEVGHNVAINEFAKNHSDIYLNFEELPTLSPDVASMFEDELNKYLWEIGIWDPEQKCYNNGSWRYLSAKNSVNKAQMFIRAKENWFLSLNEFIETNREAFKITIDGKEYDLLEGYDLLPKMDESTKNKALIFHKVSNLLFDNWNKLLSDTKLTTKELLDKSRLLSNICEPDELHKLKTVKLDLHVSYDKLTDYDKAMLIATLVSYKSDDWYQFLEGRVDSEHDIAPLTILQWVSRMAIANLKNPEIFNSFLDKIRELSPDYQLPILYNCIFTSGGAGAGKTSVEAKNVSKSIKDEEVIWLAAPEQSLVDGLLESVGRGSTMRTSLLMETVCDKELYSKLCDDYVKEVTESSETKEEEKLYTIITTPEAPDGICVLNKNKFKIKKVDNAPKLIIIDEATHLSNLDLLILSEFARQNDSFILFLGDGKLNGNTQIGLNLRREGSYCTRTPDLSITLRDNNIQHMSNILTVEALLDELSDLDATNLNYSTLVATVKSKIRKLKLKSYTGDELNGDLIVPTLTSDHVKLLNADIKGTIGYVGNNADNLAKLLLSGYDVTQMTEASVLGLEFDYTVVDLDWLAPDDSDIGSYLFLLRLYTMITRGRKGTIIISNSLPTIIGGNVSESSKAMAPDIKESIATFRDDELETIKEIRKDTPKENPSENPPKKESEENKLNTINLDSSKKLILNNTTAEGTYVFTSLPKVKGKPLAMTAEDHEGVLHISIGTLNDDGTVTSIENKGEGSKLYDILVIKDGIRQDTTKSHVTETVPQTLYYDTKHNKLSFESNLAIFNDGSTGTCKLDLTKNPYPDLIEIALNEEEPSENPEETVLYSEPATTEFENFEELDELDNDTFGLTESPEFDFDDPMLCWGSATLINYEVELRDGKQVWIRPEVINGPLRDLLFLTDSKEILEDQIKYSNLLREFKNSFLYNKTYNDLSPELKSIISEDAYNGMQFGIEVRPITNSDNFIRNTGFLTLEGFGKDKLALTVVGRFKNKEGKECSLTLGLLGSPTKYLNSVTKIQLNILRKIDKLEAQLLLSNSKLSTSKRNKLEKLKSDLVLKKQSIPTLAENYKKFIDRLLDLNPKEVIPVNKCIFTGMTHLRKVLANGDPVQKMRLGSYTLDLISGIEKSIKKYELELSKAKTEFRKEVLNKKIEKARKKIEELKQNMDNSFKKLNPYTVVSDVYVYTHAKGFTGIDDSVIGRNAVVFVSNDNTIPKDDLVKIYILLKNAVASGKPSNARVRMLVLNNMGVAFRDLSDPWQRDMMESEDIWESLKDGKKVVHTVNRITPFKTNFMGARMYVSLWNFRANLLDFNTRLNKFISKENLDRTKLENYAIAKDVEYLLSKGNKVPLEALDIYNNAIKSSDEFNLYKTKIDLFNSELNNTTKQFRLGGGYENGFYIRKISGEIPNQFYEDSTKVNGIYLTPTKAGRFLDIIDNLFTNTLDKIVECSLSKTLLLTTKDGAKNSIKNHIRLLFRDGELVINDPHTGEETVMKMSTKYDKDTILENALSNIAPVLLKVEKFVGMYQTHDNDDIFLNKSGEKTISDYFDLKIQIEGLEDIEIPYYEMFKLFPNHNLTTWNGYDTSLSDMFDLCFHGTVEDIFDSNTIKASDALFPDGFFVDPFTSGEEIRDLGQSMFKKVTSLPSFFSVDVMVDDPTFYISLQELTQAVDNYKKPEQNNNVSKYLSLFDNMVTLFPDVTSEGMIFDESDPEGSYNGVRDYVLDKIETNKLNVFASAAEASKNPIIRLNDDDTIVTLFDAIYKQYKDKYGNDLGEIKSENIKKDSSQKNTLLIETDKAEIKVTSTRDGINVERSKLETGEGISENPETEEEKIIELAGNSNLEAAKSLATDFANTYLKGGLQKLLLTYIKNAKTQPELLARLNNIKGNIVKSSNPKIITQYKQLLDKLNTPTC